ncbi:flagellar basal-body protein FlbY [Brevundimonas sp. AJA228-03]|uniref:flagellar basal-body protein FlbY n=1 Tax=Brevundimonas sp. AJA228-03 TaxID=2752515 RepID=UPI001ADFA50F|nr:flagellar basal-body protein FlbY [Brevundimonas sp. AJA228-03]QTN18966.1 flagellar basal-body protein FlbY [Brevundimonas sp. AJA228-03]
MTYDPVTATAHLRRLTDLTDRLTARLEAETDAFASRRPQDVTASLAETQELANLYRRESAQLKSNPDLLSAAPVSERMGLIKATETFEAVLAIHARTVEAARTISEGLVRTIAQEVAGARAMGTGYGASGRAATGDGRAVTLNRTA